MEVQENYKCCMRVFPHLFQVLPNFQKCFINSIEKQTKQSCFLFLLENTTKKKRKQLVYFDHQNDQNDGAKNACTIVMSTAHVTSVFLSSCRSTILTNQGMYFLFSNIQYNVKKDR